MPSGEHETLWRVKRKSHFRVVAKLLKEKPVKQEFGPGEYYEEISMENEVRTFSREDYYWRIDEETECLIVGLRNKVGDPDSDHESYVAAFNEWELVEDCAAP